MPRKPEKPPIYPWDVSATGSWSVDSGLLRLRDDDIPTLTEWLWENGGNVQISAIQELLAHGNQRKAAELAKSLVENYPVVEASLKTGLGALAQILLTTSLEKFPSKPSEHPPGAVEILQ